MIQMKLLTEQKEIHRLRKHTYGCQWEGIVRDCGKVMWQMFLICVLHCINVSKLVCDKDL